MLEEMRAAWDAEADTFDEATDHGLTDPAVRQAWVALLADVLPPPGARVLDLGSGTGTLAVLLAELGYEVVGVDLAPRMVERADQKAYRHGVRVPFLVGDASEPPVDGRFEVVLARHVLWALPDAEEALDRWTGLLMPAGVLVLIEGFWHTGAGLRAADLMPLVAARTTATSLRALSQDEGLWGGPVIDERYLITGTVASERPT